LFATEGVSIAVTDIEVNQNGSNNRSLCGVSNKVRMEFNTPVGLYDHSIRENLRNLAMAGIPLYSKQAPDYQP
jgi:hypothetical protein